MKTVKYSVNMYLSYFAVDTKRRNEHENKINWKFTRKVADEKMSKHYAQ